MISSSTPEYFALNVDGIVGSKAAPEQFKLTRTQLYNWGTFQGLHDIPISSVGHLIFGPSGSGKSTILDANATLMTPPKWLGFNMAVREGEAKGADRTMASYIRGNWGERTNRNGDAVAQVLREGSTWSAISQVYTSTLGQCITIAHVYWIRGNGSAKADVHCAYLVAQREFLLTELTPFAQSNFDIKTLKKTEKLQVFGEFSSYRDCFDKLVGIDSEGTHRLLHKAQSIKNVGDLNAFMCDFMLDPPQTFEQAKEVVSHFETLRSAKESLLQTKAQIEVLLPARQAHEELLQAQANVTAIQNTLAMLKAYREQLRRDILSAELHKVEVKIAENDAKIDALVEQEEALQSKLRTLEAKRDGGAQAKIEQFTVMAESIQQRLTLASRNEGVFGRACGALNLDMPTNEAQCETLKTEFQRQSAAIQEKLEELEANRAELSIKKRAAQAQIRDHLEQLEVMSKRVSLIPQDLHEIRLELCATLGLEPTGLMFAGELIEVKPQEAIWRGAIERALSDFAQHLMVPRELFDDVNALVSKNKWPSHLRLIRVFVNNDAPVTGSADAMVAKLRVRPDHTFSGWLINHLNEHFTHRCVESLENFVRSANALMRDGLIKNNNRLEKDARFALNDQRHWVLGGDMREKIEVARQQLDVLENTLQEVDVALNWLEDPTTYKNNVKLFEQALELAWEDIDCEPLTRALDEAKENLAVAQEAVADRQELEAQIEETAQAHREAQSAVSRTQAQSEELSKLVQTTKKQMAQLNETLLLVAIDAEIKEHLKEQLNQRTANLDIFNLDEHIGAVKEDYIKLERKFQDKVNVSNNKLIYQLREYIRQWPMNAIDLDATLASVPEFMGILTQLETDGLPNFEQAFTELIREQSLVELSRLQAQLEAERSAMRKRLSQVNESLKKANFNPGTTIVIEYNDKQLPDVIAFKQELRAAISNSLALTDAHAALERYEVVERLITRLGSAETKDRLWRELCLDVRKHVSFFIREVDAAGNEVELYRSTANKSGGQRQKLTAACVAAALSYQLGAKTHGVPRFSTIFMDEAFDKADDEYTDLALNIFKTFGFQLVVATPLKSVMTLEPYIGGASFVHILDRKESFAQPLLYLSEISEKLIEYADAT